MEADKTDDKTGDKTDKTLIRINPIPFRAYISPLRFLDLRYMPNNISLLRHPNNMLYWHMFAAIYALGIFFPFMNVPEQTPKAYNICYVNLAYTEHIPKGLTSL